MNLSDMRSRVRRDLHDEDAANYRWTDGELERHIGHAVTDLSLAIPLEVAVALSATAGSRDLSLSSITGLIDVEAVEYPTGKYPPSFVRFSKWANTLTLLVDSVPAGGAQVRLYCRKGHTLDATSSTIPAHLEDLAALGAAAYAALEWSSFATNRVNVGGSETWRNYLSWGRDRLAQFQKALGRLGANNMARTRRLYAPSVPKASQTTDWGP
ncbi:MAG: hypothetical protein HYU29_03130 [Chloroflexi bacterium]|nr:hypothetical protein [Chloroflexota bacterium]